MMRSFFNAITGLDTSRFWIDVISDNISNVNTVGFKAQRPIFQDVISQVTIGLNVVTGTLKSTTYGAGAIVDSTQKIWTIGNFKQTGINTDLAIQGRGLFILEDPITRTHYYTRDGQFRLSADGYMVNSGGFYLMGFRLDEEGNVVGTGLERIYVQQQLPPRATSTINFLQPTNLNADAIIPSSPIFDPNDPNSYSYRYSITIYDTLGNPYQADVFFKKTGINTWRMFILADYDNDGTAENLINTNFADGTENGYNFLNLIFDERGFPIKTDKVQVQTIGTKRYYYFRLFNSNNPPQDGLQTSSGGELGSQIQGLGTGDPNEMIFVIGEEVTTDNTTATVTNSAVNTFTGDGNTTTFTLNPVVDGVQPNSIYIPSITLAGTTYTDVRDDGQGNLQGTDPGGQTVQIGTINYNTGVITFNQAPDANTQFTVNYQYNVINRDLIASPYLNQFAADFVLTLEQNGYAKGDLIDVYVLSEDGSVVGVYSNGKSLPLYRVAIAVFADPEELTKKGANLYTSISTPTILLAGGSEKVRSGMLEMSNSDIAKEFINLITAQRAYQANARVITTANTILDETVNLVR